MTEWFIRNNCIQTARILLITIINLIQDGVSYPTMIKLDTVIPYLKKFLKNINHVTHSLISAGINIFSPEIKKYGLIKKFRYKFHVDTQFLILLTFLESLRIALINKVRILMMSAKMLTQ